MERKRGTKMARSMVHLRAPKRDSKRVVMRDLKMVLTMGLMMGLPKERYSELQMEIRKVYRMACLMAQTRAP